jgi:hypothetical protein
MNTGAKKREALDVIPVGVREQDGAVTSAFAKLGLKQLSSQADDARSHVEHQQLALIGSKAHAAGVAAVTDCLGTRGGDRPAYTVKGYFHDSPSLESEPPRCPWPIERLLE